MKLFPVPPLEAILVTAQVCVKLDSTTGLLSVSGLILLGHFTYFVFGRALPEVLPVLAACISGPVGTLQHMEAGHDDEVSSQDGAWEQARIAGEAAEREAAAHLAVALPTTPEGTTAEANAVVAQILTEWKEADSAPQTEASDTDVQSALVTSYPQATLVTAGLGCRSTWGWS